MVTYANARADVDCTSNDGVVFVSNVRREEFTEADEVFASDQATTVLTIDVLTAPFGVSLRPLNSAD